MTVHLPLLETGVPGLDVLLGGGIARSALVFLAGPPGAGKTVLGSQIIFHAAARGERTLILTAYSEGHDKLLEHLRSFTYFDAELIGDSITLLSLQALVGRDADIDATELVRTIRASQARVVLLDGFQGVADRIADSDATRRLLASIGNQLAYLGVTLFVTAEGSARSPGLSVEQTTADVVIGLDYGVEGWRHTRRLDVVKQRGQGLLGGLHPYTITEAGVTVHPRLEALPHPGPRVPFDPRGRASFGLPELDAMVGGGLTRGSTTILAGPHGVGKTTLALHWALSGCPSMGGATASNVFLSLREQPEQLREKAAIFGLAFDRAIDSGGLELHRISPVELNPDAFASMLLDRIANTNLERLVIDGLASVLLELGDRSRDYLAALWQHLYSAGVTSLFILEIEPSEGFRLDIANTPISAVSENVIVLQHQQVDGALRRLLAILSMRFSAFDKTLRELVIDERGLRVLIPGQPPDEVLDDRWPAE